MFDLNTIIVTALNQAIEQATKPLIERIAALESQALAERVTELENRNKDKENVHDASVEVQLNRLDSRIDVLESWHEDAITADQVSSLIEEALNEIDWEDQVHDVLNGHVFEEQVKDTLSEMLSDLRITLE